MPKKPRWIRNVNLDKQSLGQLGLGLVDEKFVSYVFVPEGVTRNIAVRLNTSEARVKVRDKSVASWSWGRGNAKNGYCVAIKGIREGHTKIDAHNYAGTTTLHVHVGRPRHLFVSFRPVRSDRWVVQPDKGRMNRILDRLNKVYWLQGNIRFREVGSQAVTISDLREKVMKADMERFVEHRSTRANVTLFMVRDFEVFGTSWKDMVILSAGTTQDGRRDTKIACHEVGHFMGLPHPKPGRPGNMMNKGNANHPSWVSIDGRQIGRIVDATNWNG